MADPITTITPDFTGVVDQRFFLAPLGGPRHPTNYLDRFPEELYTKSIDSHLVKFLYSLLGPAGIGWLRKNYLEARLKLEDFGLENFDLDKFYGDPIGFGRILEELYEEDPSGALTPEQWEVIRAKDARYRNRAIDFVNGAKAGGTPLGMHLVARSGLGHEVEVFERYRYLWDQLTDDQIGIPDWGTSGNMNEMVVIPRRELPQSEVQELVISGTPTGGTFRLLFPIGDEAANQTNDIAYNAVSGGSRAPNAWDANRSYALNDIVSYLGYAYKRIIAGTTSTNPLSDTTNWASIGLIGIQDFLEAIPSIGPGNVRVTGGPLPGKPISILFTGNLAYKDVPQLRAISSTLTGGSSPAISITTTTSGLDQTDEVVAIPPRDKYYLMQAINRIKPVSVWSSFEQGKGLASRQIWNGAFSGSAQHEVVRYVTGQSGVTWPSVDDDFQNWIEGGKEHKNLRGPADITHHYQGYHNVASIRAYTEAALDDVNYLTTFAPSNDYLNEKVGNYTSYQQALFPVLNENVPQHFADMALADYPEPLTIQNSAQEAGMINGIYPISYQELDGIPQVKYLDDQFWGSTERATGEDYLEIDLGSVQAVNYIYFEATQKPYDISVSYDLLDQAPARSWADVQYTHGLPTNNRLDYQSASTNPWKPISMWIENSLGGLIFTRFIRIKFAKRTGDDSPFVEADGTPIQSSIEVKNLRVARSVG